MTACKDSLNGKKAVSATLAGALAVGMVPAAAFAATDAEQPETGDIELQATMPKADQFTNGSVTAATVGGEASEVNEIEVTANGAETLKVVPTEVTLADGKTAVDVTDTAKYAVTYKAADKDGKPTGEALKAAPTTAGSYVAIVTANDGDYKGGSCYVKFNVVAKSIKGATAYEANDKDDTDFSDTTFTYSAAEQSIDFVLDGKKLVKAASDGAATGDYTVTYYQNNKVVSAVENAGSYVAVLKGQNDYAGSEAQVAFEVEKFDVSGANIVIADTTSAEPTQVASINGKADSKLIGKLGLTFKSAANGDLVFKNNTTYTYTVAAKDEKDANITGTQDVTFDKTGKVLADTAFLYDGTAMDKAITVDHSVKGAKDVDASKITVKDGDKELTSDQYTVSVTDKDGNAATTADLSKPGKWTVTVKVNSAATDYELGGTFQSVVTVKEGTIAGATSVIVTFDGKAVADSVNTPYDGTDQLQKLDVTVKVGGKVLSEGTDYTLKVTTDKDGKTVDADEAVDADIYTVSVKSDSYDVNSADFTLAVDAIAISGEYNADAPVAGQLRVKDLNVRGFIAYTGEEIVPELEYVAAVKDGKAVWADLPSDQYKITAKKDSKDAEILETGNYTLAVKDVKDTPNYTITDTTLKLTVSNQRVFKDVPNGEYFTDPIYKLAQDSKYMVGKTHIMSGYNDSDFFGPYNELTRAETATVVGRLAGVPVDDDDAFNSVWGISTPFSDVQSGAWYANAVAWAAKAGVVTGYGDGTFAPDQSITREQFALMLYRYAEKCGYDTTADAADLAALPDASGVSDWAKTAVEWAVSKGFIGQGGVVDAQGTLTRGMAATIMVRYMDTFIVK